MISGYPQFWTPVYCLRTQGFKMANISLSYGLGNVPAMLRQVRPVEVDHTQAVHD